MDTAPKPYDVIVGAGLIGRLGELVLQAGIASPGTRIFIAHDRGLPSAMVETAVRAMTDGGLRPSMASIVAEESAKTLESAERLLVEIARTRHERNEPLLAMGGGIVGDVAGFAAATYRRGIPIIQAPTTLLGMVDAAVGGKTGVNLEIDGGLMKNVVGVFHQPGLVVADVSVLRSLPARQMRCGLAECIKHGMIGASFGESGLLDWIEARADAILGQDAGTLIELVARNVALKAAVVAEDEREESADAGRALLNLGHTFGHAIETTFSARPAGSTEKGLHHGEAVALGLLAAARCAEEAGICRRDLGVAEGISRVVRRCGLPTGASGLPSAGDIRARMAHDKKVKSGMLRLVLPTGPGSAGLFEDVPDAAIIAAIESLRVE